MYNIEFKIYEYQEFENAYPEKVITKLNQLANEYVPALEELV